MQDSEEADLGTEMSRVRVYARRRSFNQPDSGGWMVFL